MKYERKCNMTPKANKLTEKNLSNSAADEISYNRIKIMMVRMINEMKMTHINT
jgi:type III secretory pathway lipoprotein EscJ